MSVISNLKKAFQIVNISFQIPNGMFDIYFFGYSLLTSYNTINFISQCYNTFGQQFYLYHAFLAFIYSEL